MTVVDAKTFWTDGLNSDEAKGITVRVGPFRCAPLNSAGAANPDPLAEYPERWGCLRDGFDYPYGETFASRQEAVNWMVDRALAQHDYPAERFK